MFWGVGCALGGAAACVGGGGFGFGRVGGGGGGGGGFLSPPHLGKPFLVHGLASQNHLGKQNKPEFALTLTPSLTLTLAPTLTLGSDRTAWPVPSTR